MKFEVRPYIYVLRNEEDSNNYLKDVNETIICYDSYKQATISIEDIIDSSSYENIPLKIECVNLTIKYVVENKNQDSEDFGKQEVLNMYQLLCEINRNRSMEWVDFDQTDILSGLADFTEYKLVGVYLEVT